MRAFRAYLVAGKPTVRSSDLQLIWTRLSLPMEAFETILSAGRFSDQTEWMKFLALACYCVGKTYRDAGISLMKI
ncbi:hypothetical protein NDU88_006963 [Pleurodeles waltl]|uniref:Uncharacterized protein n=1 Tax=Pleurodeles waltl TaxID=8319 RepID=A0AAV7UMJ6_PLEWA|nr:hypothetical protein NDU88_006963 [Pleurodeles waltl]